MSRYKKLSTADLIKGPWTYEEDRKLLKWIQSEGPKKWSLCAETISGRSGKQCRERWFNALNPQVKKGEWTIEEDFKIYLLYSQYGNGQKLHYIFQIEQKIQLKIDFIPV